MILEEAEALAEHYKHQLEFVCERIEIAGSVRRQKPEVHDIELVAIPKLEASKDMFGQQTGTVNLLDIYCDDFCTMVKNGHRYKQIKTPGINIDLFIVLPPAQWGVIFTLRTGPAEFSHRIVTAKKFGGNLPSNCQVKDGGVYKTDEPIQFITMPEEIDFLNFLGLGWIEPKDRK